MAMPQQPTSGVHEWAPITFYAPASEAYSLLPFRFKRLSGSQGGATEGRGDVLLTNLVGEYIILSGSDFEAFRQKRLPVTSSVFQKLLAKHFVRGDSPAQLELLASRLWTKKSFMVGFTKLHIFVLTLRCNASCVYCQVTRQNEDAPRSYDMSPEVARASVDMMMKSPSRSITVEFQGGEPLLNFDVLKEVVLYTEVKNAALPEGLKKDISFVVCTNLSRLTDDMLTFFKAHGVGISTSVDGPATLHDSNRARSLKHACHRVVEKNLRWAQEALGRSQVSALMTTTRQSLGHAKEIIDEYLRLDLGSIFIRALNPYGYATKTGRAIDYTVPEFVEFYKTAFDYIMAVNRTGRVFPEAYAGLLLKKILTPWTVGFVDLQSPTGNGFAVTVYNYDGDVYASDESRMLFEMGDAQFRLGSVLEDSFEDIYFGQAMQLIASTGVAECLAGCESCVYVPYCGADPIRHYATQHDAYGNRARSTFCQKNKAIFDFLFEKLRHLSPQDEDILWSWLTDRSVEELTLKDPTDPTVPTHPTVGSGQKEDGCYSEGGHHAA